MALKRAEKWLLERFEMSDGLGAIYPAMLNAIVALACLGYTQDDPQFIRAMDEFEQLGIDKPKGEPNYPTPTFRMQPCMSPVWDTAQAVYALGEAGVAKNDPRLLKAADWLLSKEVRHKGDWAQSIKDVAPGGWYFEFNNEFYPDVDDSAQVLLALNHVRNPRERYQHEVCARALDWIFAMQCRNGGWASFDRDNTKMIFQYIPFADHNAMLDPPTVDITGRILEMLASYGYTRRDKRVERAVQFVLKSRSPTEAGSGAGASIICMVHFWCCAGWRRWACGATSRRLCRLRSGFAWCRTRTADGARLATVTTIPDQRGIGPSTPSQTAWAVLGLLAAGDTRSDSVAKGIRWLVSRQLPNGTWDESAEGRNGEAIYTGTGFPRVFYLAYHLYRDYFPLLALTTYKRVMEREIGAA